MVRTKGTKRAQRDASANTGAEEACCGETGNRCKTRYEDWLHVRSSAKGARHTASFGNAHATLAPLYILSGLCSSYAQILGCMSRNNTLIKIA